MDNSLFLHSDKHPEPNEDNSQKARDDWNLDDTGNLNPLPDPAMASTQVIMGIANAIPDIFFILNLTNKSIIYASKQIISFLGYEEDQNSLIEQPILDFIHEEDRAIFEKHLNNLQTAEDGIKTEIEYRMLNKDGSPHLFVNSINVFNINDDVNAVGKFAIVQDITLRKAQEDSINKSIKILQQTEELAQVGSWDYDINTRKFSWSEGMYNLFGITKDTPVQPTVYIDHAIEKDKPVAKKIAESIQQTFEPFEQILSIQVGKNVKTIKVKSDNYKDDKGQRIAVIGVDIDITASLLTNMQITELNQNLQIKNRGLESANTDLKAFNTLAATNYRQTLQKLYTSMEYLVTHDARNLSNEGRANIRRAQSSIQKMKLMTEDIINLSKLHTIDTQLAKVDLNKILEEAINSMQDKIREAKIMIDYPQMPIIQGYSTLISLLFYHLLDNAIKFRRHDVAAKVNFKRNVLIQTGITYTVISITDNGIGFEPEKEHEVFTMFYRTEDAAYKGSGIGLAVCKKIMDIHNGFILASSIPNKETTFNCFFPIGQAAR